MSRSVPHWGTSTWAQHSPLHLHQQLSAASFLIRSTFEWQCNLQLLQLKSCNTNINKGLIFVFAASKQYWNRFPKWAIWQPPWVVSYFCFEYSAFGGRDVSDAPSPPAGGGGAGRAELCEGAIMAGATSWATVITPTPPIYSVSGSPTLPPQLHSVTPTHTPALPSERERESQWEWVVRARLSSSLTSHHRSLSCFLMVSYHEPATSRRDTGGCGVTLAHTWSHTWATCGAWSPISHNI